MQTAIKKCVGMFCKEALSLREELESFNASAIRKLQKPELNTHPHKFNANKRDFQVHHQPLEP